MGAPLEPLAPINEQIWAHSEPGIPRPTPMVTPVQALVLALACRASKWSSTSGMNGG